jgi:hypothetical protein
MLPLLHPTPHLRCALDGIVRVIFGRYPVRGSLKRSQRTVGLVMLADCGPSLTGKGRDRTVHLLA